MAGYWTKLLDERSDLLADQVQQLCWQPLADIYRVRGGWLVKFDLAGIRPEEVRLSVCGSCLTVAGRRSDWQIDEFQQHYRLEIAYSRFERTVEFPCDLERARISTDYRDGMLLIRMATEEGVS
jgi:HSP20 family protein